MGRNEHAVIEMRYENFDAPCGFEDWDRLTDHWRSRGWEPIPESDEAAIKQAWEKTMERQSKVVWPSPFCTWDASALWELGEQAEDVESEVTLKVLGAFRRCVRPGERLLVIEWPHPWYYFDPCGGVTRATRDEWAYSILPDQYEPHFFLASDFRFGVGTDVGRRLTLFGGDLLAAFAADPPRRFLSFCNAMHKTDRKLWRKGVVQRMRAVQG